MRWDSFCAQLNELGYEGPTDQFDAVKSFLQDEGYDTETVEAEGKSYELRELFDSRPGKPLDASKAAKRAEFEDEVDRRVRESLKRLEGAKTYKGGGVAREVKHDVKVVGERIAEDPLRGYKSLGEFLMDVKNAGLRDGGGISEKLNTYNRVTKSAIGSDTVSQESVGSDGGFAVPPVMLEQIMSQVSGEDSIAGRCDTYTMSRNSLAVPSDEDTPWGTSNGVRANWEGETGAYAQSKVDLDLKELRLRKLTVLAPVTEELLEDATAMETYLTRKATEKIDYALGEAIFRGSGSGQPLGFLNSDSLIEVAKVSSQTAATITQSNIESMWERMYAPYRGNSVWFIHHEVEKELARMSFQARTDAGAAISGESHASYIAPGGMRDDPFGRLLGRPVIVTQHCNELGDAGDIVFAAMNRYWLGMKAGGIDSQTSIHLWFDQDVVAFKFRMRVDGQPWLSNPITPRDGSTTQSAFVSVAVRA